VVLFEDFQNAERREAARETSAGRGLRLPGWTWRLELSVRTLREVCACLVLPA